MEIQAKLAEGIKAAKAGDKAAARDILYQVIDLEPQNEAAWVWLSSVVDDIEDQQICLENVLFINPENVYAQQGLNQLRQLVSLTQKSSSPRLSSAPTRLRRTIASVPLTLIVAFWSGIGGICLILGLWDFVQWSIALTESRTFPRYITTYQLFTLMITVTICIIGVIAINLAWALFKRHRSGYFVSIILSLGLTLVGPLALLIVAEPNFVLVGFMALMPATVVILTLLSQAEFEHD